MSKYIIENKSEYYRLIREVTENAEWDSWVRFVLNAVEKTAEFTRKKILVIRDLLNETLDYARKNLPRRVYSKELIEILFRQPYTKGQFLVDAGIAKRKTAAEYLKELERIGVLKRQKIGKENLFLNVKLHKLLES